MGRGLAPSMVVGLLGVAALPADAQEAAPRAGLSVTPEFGIRQTMTDNVLLASTDRHFDLITDLSPRLRIGSNAGRVRGFFDYALHGLVYAHQSSLNSVQQSLSAAGTAEAIDRWAYLDASALISQQYISALGTRSTDPSLVDTNRTEVSSVQLSPYVRGRLGGLATYEARATWASTRSKNSNANSDTSGALLRVGSDTSTFARVGWSANWSHQVIDFSASGKSQTDRLDGVLTFAATRELSFSLRAGHETNDLLTLDKKGYKNWGWGGTWTPTERTRLEVAREQRFFGASHNVRFEHRMPRSVWSFSDAQNVVTNAQTGGASAPSTVFDLLFAQFASIAPDPIQRAALVDAFLQNNGLTRATLANGGFLTSAASVQRNQNASVALLGVRTTVLLSAFRSDGRTLNPAATVTGDLANGNTLHQLGLGVNVSHRLTPLSALSMDFNRTKTSASLGNQQTDLRSLTLTWSNRLRADADLSLSARRALFQSATNPYAESALIADLRLRF